MGVTINVIGKVQGVFFRVSAKEKADELGVLGTVKNEKDGSVFIEAEGNEENLNRFIEWCKKGPSKAVVLEVKIEMAKPKQFHTFEILR